MSTVATVSSIIGLLVAAVNGYLIYKGSNEASKRSTDVQRQANSVDGFARLTDEQRKELERVRARADEAEATAEKAQTAAEEATRTAERCQLLVVQLTEAYRELHEWASQPCPHTTPPPRPPLYLVEP